MYSLKAFLATKKKSMLLLIFAALLTGVMIVAQAYFLVAVIDGVFLKDQSFSQVLPLLGGLLVVFFLRTFATYVSGRKGIQLGAAAKGYFRKALLKKYARNPLQASLKGQSGKKVSILLDAIDEVDGYFSSYIPQVIRTAFIPLLILIVVFTQHTNTGWIMLITAPFIPIFMIIIGIQTKSKSEEQMEKLNAFSGRFLDTLQGLVTLKLFGRSSKEKETIRKSSLGFRDATMEILKVAFTQSFMLELISMLSIGIVALEVSLQLIIFDGIGFFTAFFVLILTPEFYTALKDLGSAFHNGQTSIGAAKNVMAELNEDDQGMEWGKEQLAAADVPPKMELQHVGFHYDEGEFALENIQAVLPENGQIAIVGRSGSGKTTLVNLIAGLIAPSSGEVLVNGKALRAYQEQEWFGQVSYISQHPYIFSGTIAENIAVGGQADASREAIEQAAEQAGITELIQSLENGYDTVIGEGGRGLSGGEMQRVALARAFLKKPSVILFDEPTTGLDLHTEQVLQSAMKQLAQHATVITVAHRLHTIKDADMILFLDDGMLMAAGTHAELLATVDAYREMVAIQQGRDE